MRFHPSMNLRMQENRAVAETRHWPRDHTESDYCSGFDIIFGGQKFDYDVSWFGFL